MRGGIAGERADVPWLSRGDLSIELNDGETVVGSGEHATWTVRDGGLAPRHIAIEVHRGAASVRPFGPDAIVTLNGRQVAGESARLRDGDVVAAGRVAFLFSAERPASRATPSAGVAPQTDAYLVDARTGAAYPLGAPSTGIGRDRANAIVVTDATASRFHAEVRCEAGGWVLHPMGSSGTHVNGRRTGTPCLLEDGDEIEVAYTTLRFKRGAPPHGADAPRRPAPTAEELDAARRPTIEVSEDDIDGAAPPAPSMTDAPPTRARWPLWLAVAIAMLAAAVWVATRG